MSGGQIAALICAILLLLPGGCFFILGVAVVSDHQFSDAAWVAFLIAAGIATLAGVLFWFALRRRRPS